MDGFYCTVCEGSGGGGDPVTVIDSLSPKGQCPSCGGTGKAPPTQPSAEGPARTPLEKDSVLLARRSHKLLIAVVEFLVGRQGRLWIVQ